MSATKSKDGLAVEPNRRGGRTRSRSPRPKSGKNTGQERSDYGSDGVEDHDIFGLPVSDYKWIAALTLVAAVVRLFRIYQPTSVVFDEVQ